MERAQLSFNYWPRILEKKLLVILRTVALCV